MSDAAQDHDERRELEDAWIADNRDAEYEECVKQHDSTVGPTEEFV